MIAFGIGGVGGDGNAPRRHDRQVADAPFGPVFGYQHDPVTGVQPDRFQRRCKCCNLRRGRCPADRLPAPARLGPEERLVTACAGAREKHRDEIGKMFKLSHHFSRKAAPATASCRAASDWRSALIRSARPPRCAGPPLQPSRAVYVPPHSPSTPAARPTLCGPAPQARVSAPRAPSPVQAPACCR